MRAQAAEMSPQPREPSRIAGDVLAIVGLAAERVALQVAGRLCAGVVAAPNGPRDVRWDAMWKAAAVGAVAALPFDPVLGIVASAMEAGLLAEIEARALEKLGAVVVSDASGHTAVSHVGRGELRSSMIGGSAQNTLVAIARRAARSVPRVALKEVGVALPRLALRAVLGVAAPIVSVASSAAWNTIDMHRKLTPAVLVVEALDTRPPPRRVDAGAPRAIEPSTWGSAAMAAA